jgi:hypothetical protein
VRFDGPTAQLARGGDLELALLELLDADRAPA